MGQMIVNIEGGALGGITIEDAGESWKIQVGEGMSEGLKIDWNAIAEKDGGLSTDRSSPFSLLRPSTIPTADHCDIAFFAIVHP